MDHVYILSQIWPEWHVVRLIGKGSYGSVYEAERIESSISSKAAIKVISVPQDSTELDSLRSEGMTIDNAKAYYKSLVDDFVGEIRIMDSLKGVQNIVSVEDYKVIEKQGEIGWFIFIRMELLTPFNSYIINNEITEGEIIKLGTDICTALELCSRMNIIHRDIKPENIFVNAFGDFKLGDFGIARKLENASSGMSMKGTFSYMAPEIERGLSYDSSVDIYSLGLVLYRLANNNRLPFLDTDKQVLSPNERVEAARRRFSGEKLPAPCGVSKDLADIILCACEYEPKKRFASARAMKSALNSISLSDATSRIIPQQFPTSEIPRGASSGAGQGKNDYHVGASQSAQQVSPYSGQQAQQYSGQNAVPPYQQQAQYNRQGGYEQQNQNNYGYGQQQNNGNGNRNNTLIPIIIVAAVAVIAIVIVLILVIPGVTNRNKTESYTTAATTTRTVEETAAAAWETTAEQTAAVVQNETGSSSGNESSNLYDIAINTSETTTAAEATQTQTTTAAAEQTQIGTGSAEETPASNASEVANEPTGQAPTSGSSSAGSMTLHIGDVVTFGSYEQDNNQSNGTEPIEWIVLYEESGNHLLISKYALDAKPFDTGSATSWDNCTLRTWLNSTFYNAAFSSSDRNLIVESAKTHDNVSLLGYDSTGDSGVTYFLTSESSRQCYATDYALSNGAFVNAQNGHSPWWLRAMVDSSSAYMVTSTGAIGNNLKNNGASQQDINDNLLVTVRPIIWLNF